MIEEESPLGGVTAFVEDDGRAVWLYVRGEGRRRAAWLANRVAAPEGEDVEARSAGLPPRLARTATAHPEGRGPLRAPAIVWLEDGESLVVLEDGDAAGDPGDANDARGAYGGERRVVGAVIDGVPMARDARAPTPWARPLDPATAARAREANAFWDRWRGPRAERTWAVYRDGELAQLEASLGPHGEYLAVDAGRFPPLAVARFANDVFCTIGMGAFPMPGARGARLELAVAAGGAATWPPQVLAWLARWPWRHGAPLDEHHVVVAPALNATWLAPDTSGVLLTRGMGAPDLGAHRQWVVPLTLDEIRSAEVTGGAALAAALTARGRSHVAR